MMRHVSVGSDWLVPFALPFILLMISMWSPPCSEARLQDRIVAIVNSELIMLSDVKREFEITQAELDAYYEKHANQLLDPLKANVSVMLLPNVYAAKDLEAQVNRGGSFAKFAQRYSIDEKTKSKGGELGPYRKGLVLPEVDAVIHTLKLGMVSAPIKTDHGYYLVMLTPLDEAVIQTDLATQERLRQELLSDKRRKRFEEVIADIRANAVVRFAEASRHINEDTGKR